MTKDEQGFVELTFEGNFYVHLPLSEAEGLRDAAKRGVGWLDCVGFHGEAHSVKLSKCIDIGVWTPEATRAKREQDEYDARMAKDREILG